MEIGEEGKALVGFIIVLAFFFANSVLQLQRGLLFLYYMGSFESRRFFRKKAVLWKARGWSE